MHPVSVVHSKKEIVELIAKHDVRFSFCFCFWLGEGESKLKGRRRFCFWLGEGESKLNGRVWERKTERFRE